MRTFFTISAILIAGVIGFLVGNSSPQIGQQAIASSSSSDLELALKDARSQLNHYEIQADMLAMQLNSLDSSAFSAALLLKESFRFRESGRHDEADGMKEVVGQAVENINNYANQRRKLRDEISLISKDVAEGFRLLQNLESRQ